MTTGTTETFEQQIQRAKRAKQRNRIFYYALITFVLLTFGFVFAFPLLFMFMSSFKGNTEIFEDVRSFRAFLPVGDVSLNNYRDVLQGSNFSLYFRNSLIITLSTLALSLFVNSMAAFALSRLQWRGQRIVLAAIVATLIIPFEAIAIPMLIEVSQLPWFSFSEGWKVSWFNTYHVQIIPFIANAISIFLFHQFFLDIPKELDEAAEVDGASPWRIYWNILVPISRPVFATVAILQFLSMWNAYLWPIMVVQGQFARPIMPGIQQYFGRVVEWGPIMAYASLVTIPILIVFLLFQNWFIASIASSGTKG